MKTSNKTKIDKNKVSEYLANWIGWFFNDLDYPLPSNSRDLGFNKAEIKEIEKAKAEILKIAKRYN